MGAISKTFKSGDGVAVMLPAEWGVGPDSTVFMERDHETIHVRTRPDAAHPDGEEKRRKLQDLLAALDALGPVGEVQDREEIRIEFPDRPGLY